MNELHFGDFIVISYGGKAEVERMLAFNHALSIVADGFAKYTLSPSANSVPFKTTLRLLCWAVGRTKAHPTGLNPVFYFLWNSISVLPEPLMRVNDQLVMTTDPMIPLIASRE